MTEKTDKKQSDHLFQKGQSGNPAGRPKGARNKATMAALKLLDGEAEALTRKVIKMALNGDIQSLRLCLERIVAPIKERPVNITLPTVETDEDLPHFLAELMEAVAAGEIKATEAAIMVGMLKAHGEARVKASRAEWERKLTEAGPRDFLKELENDYG